jgi:hypothetical protein
MKSIDADFISTSFQEAKCYLLPWKLMLQALEIDVTSLESWC